MPLEKKYLILSESCSLKNLEELYLYHRDRDELYEVNQEGFDFLKLCDGTREQKDLRWDEEFVKYCFEEGLLTLHEKPFKRKIILSEPVKPSLRYLELQITDKCNLKCRHCYLGKQKNQNLNLEKIFDICGQFERIQGLRLIISGGEPLLHQEFWKLNDRINKYQFRSILLSNGTLITPQVAKRLKVQEVQISIDGMEDSHDLLRGRGTFKAAMRGAENILKAGIDLSIATMIHLYNLNDFDKMGNLFKDMGVKGWSVDFPVLSGNLKKNPNFFLSSKQAGKFLKYGFGSGLYESSGEFACGSHLCAITPDGKVCKCSFFVDQLLGNIYNDDLKSCWKKLRHLRLDDLKCKMCKYLMECRGGCRFRAFLEGDLRGADSVRCAAFGVKPNTAIS